MQVTFSDISNQGLITVNINSHTHSFGSSYFYLNTTTHSSKCECGETRIEGHAVLVGSKTCVKCGGRVDMGFEGMNINSMFNMITENGSVKLPNGIIILKNEDLIDYLNGTLKFLNKSNTVLNK